MIFHKIQEVVQFPVFEPCPVWPAGHVIVHSLIPLAVLKQACLVTSMSTSYIVHSLIPLAVLKHGSSRPRTRSQELCTA